MYQLSDVSVQAAAAAHRQVSSPEIAHIQVADVKQKIESSQGADFPASQQVIIYQGKVGRFSSSARHAL
jgi:hypothetical protein